MRAKGCLRSRVGLLVSGSGGGMAALTDRAPCPSPRDFAGPLDPSSTLSHFPERARLPKRICSLPLPIHPSTLSPARTGALQKSAHEQPLAQAFGPSSASFRLGCRGTPMTKRATTISGESCIGLNWRLPNPGAPFRRHRRQRQSQPRRHHRQGRPRASGTLLRRFAASGRNCSEWTSRNGCAMCWHRQIVSNPFRSLHLPRGGGGKDHVRGAGHPKYAYIRARRVQEAHQVFG
jgi:hypothetical protein